ncbi:MAG: co-chaperone DjlA [Proteobacteria bacterium]|nr:co-chaperone DjlA [Pseudomonadota bacterium]
MMTIGIGSIIGGILGYKFGGFLGMVFGFWLGQMLSKSIESSTSSPKKRAIQESYFTALFLTLGKIAKIDGKVTATEIQRAQGIMQHMRLNEELRQRAIKLFNKGKTSGYDINPALRKFARLSRSSLSLRQMFLEMLVDVAEADGIMSASEWKIIDRTCDMIGYPKNLFLAMLKMRGFKSFNQQHSSNQQYQYQKRTSSKDDPYMTLGVNSDDSKAVIRRAYKKLMGQHHPDKLIAKGLPPEMVKVAEEKAKKIQSAWESVKDLRGFG